ncbi:MAG: nucleotidyltransferase domain-containing protein [Erysipelotrichales bacterium]|nr:nucleotidyltransferase domain-containing protein [Erysipelotrichales bacterium]
MLAYYCGSVAYGTQTKESDTDIIVVLDEFNGIEHYYDLEEKCEYFIFGVKNWIEKMEYDEEVALYLKMFNDDILADVELIKLEDSFKPTYDKYRNRDFKDIMQNYLKTVIEYYSILLEYPDLRKNYYHLYRIEAQIKHYLETNVFTINLSTLVPLAQEKIEVYKENFKSNNKEFYKDFKLILNYLKGVLRNVND